MRFFRIVIFSLFSISFYGQNDTLSVVRHTDNDFIIPKNLKVIYRGLPNEIFIDVPNAKSFKVSGNGVTKKNQNIYYLNASEGFENVITIDIVLKNNKKFSEKQVFKIRELSKLLPTLNHQQGTIFKLQKNNLKDVVLSLKFADGNVTTDFVFISKFTLKIPGREPNIIIGSRIDDKTLDEINKFASNGDQITIYDISTIIRCSTSFVIFDLDPIIVTIL